MERQGHSRVQLPVIASARCTAIQGEKWPRPPKEPCTLLADYHALAVQRVEYDEYDRRDDIPLVNGRRAEAYPTSFHTRGRCIRHGTLGNRSRCRPGCA